jgi:phospholipase C
MIQGYSREFKLVFLLLAVAVIVSCGGGSGGGPKTPDSPTVTFSASPTTINAGETVTLTWQSTNSNSITIKATVGSSTRVVTTSSNPSGSVDDAPTESTTYTATATGPGGNAQKDAAVTVIQNVPPEITQFSVDPTTISSGQVTTFTWATTNATSVTITPPLPLGDDSGPLMPNGSATVPIDATTTFTMTASGPGGDAKPKSTTVTVPFTLSFTASPSTITPGQTSTLSWNVTNGTATSLVIDHGVCDPCTLPKDTADVTPSVTTTYTATATASNGGVIKQSATVTVSSGSVGVIKHIFFMLQENRSFDMYLGQLGLYRPGRLAQFGITDNQTINEFDPNVTLTNSHTGAQVKPFHETTMCTENLSPAWDESHHDVSLVGGDNAWLTTNSFNDNSFGMHGFLDTTDSVPQLYDPDGTRAMGYYNQDDLPYYYDLATFFATSDRWHSPILANTVPNRMYLMAGSSLGHEYPDGDANHPKYSAKTLFRAMNDANVSWLYYYKDGIFLANFADFYDPTIQPKTFPISDLMSRLSGICSGNPCDPDEALPQVIFIDSASGDSGLDEHPDNNIQTGSAYVKSIIDALMKSDAWQDSAFILTYDEGGGLYDHVAPVMVPPPDGFAPGNCPDPNNGSQGYCRVGNLGGTFNLTGFRVPVMVVSPYAKPHYVSHTPRDYLAILAFIEQTFSIPALTARDAYWQDPTRDMSEFFDFNNPALLNAPNGDAWTNVLNAQPTDGVCDQTKESGP